MNLIKVLYLISSLRKCGPTNQLYNLIKYLDREKYDPQIFTLSKEGDRSIYDDFVRLSVPVKCLDIRKYLPIRFSKSGIIRHILEFSPDLIHSTGLRSDFISLNVLKDTPGIITVRNYPDFVYPLQFGKIKGMIMARKHINIFKQSRGHRKLVACSKSLSEKLSYKIGLENEIIANGVDDINFAFSTSEDKFLKRESLKLPQNKKIFISVGSLIEIKDHFTTLKAFKLFPEDLLIILGDGNLRDSLNSKKPPNVFMPGNVNNVVDYLVASDYFISSSLSEGMPNSVLEAMAIGLPCILSDIESHSEITESDPESSLLFKTGDYRELSKCINEIRKLNYSDIRILTRENVSKNFSACSNSKKYQKLYCEILGMKC